MKENFNKINKKLIIKRSNDTVTVNNCFSSSIFYQKAILELNEKSNDDINLTLTKI